MAKRKPDNAVTAFARATVRRKGAAHLVKLACARHLRDLKRGDVYFDAAKAAWAIEFFSHLRHSKGASAGTPFILEPWQAFIVGSLFGWRMSKGGPRRFRTAYVEVPRKNGKSTLSAGIALLLAFFDDEAGAEVFCAATKRDQARIVFEEAQRMVKASPSLKKRITSFVGNLHIQATAQKLQPLGADADSMDGLNIHGAIVDELHAHKTRAMVDVLETATGARRQPLIFYITTAGYDRHSVCWERHAYTERVLEGTLQDDQTFGFISAADEGSDYRDPKTWAKANPNLGVSVSVDDLERKARRAAEIPAEQNAFRRLHLNQWTEQEVRWLDMAVWGECSGPVDWKELRDELQGSPCWLGMDLASTLDITAVVGWFPERLAVVPFFWIPEVGMRQRSDRDRVPYDQWVAEGAVFVTPGEVTDQDQIERFIFEQLVPKYQVREIAFDPWNATQLATRLTTGGAQMVSIGQTIAMMAESVKRIEELVVGRKLIHGGHPVLRWMASNAETRADAYGNRKIVKPDRGSTKRVDGMVALAMAVSRELRQGPAAGGVEVWVA